MKKLGSIKTKLIAIMALLVMVPVIVLTIISMEISIDQTKAAADEVNSAQAALVAQEIETICASNIEALRSFASSPLVIEYLEKGEPDEEMEAEILRQMLVVDANMNDGNATALTDATGQQRIRTIGKTVDVAEREYFKQPMSGAPYYVSDMIISKSTGTAITTISVPVIGSDGTSRIGIVQRNYDCGVLHDKLAAEVTQERQEIVMVDRTGTVVAHSLREINVEDPEMQDQNPFYTDSRGDKTEGNYIAPFAGDTWVISWEKIPTSEWVVASCRVQEVALASAYKTALLQGILGLVFIVAGIAVAYIFSRSITKPLITVEDSLEALSNGEFKKAEGFDGRSDELGSIIKNTNNVVDKLDGIVNGIVKSANNVDSASNGLASMSDQISGNALSVSDAVQDIASGASRQAEELQIASSNMSKIENAIANVQSSTADLESITSRMQEESKESAERLAELKKTSETMNNAINGIAEKIGATSDAVERINGMVEAITSIASQTNLLSLNASIEAARAGEAGRGFAVVAEEIGKLALDSNQSAESIRKEMEALLSESQDAVGMADRVQKNNTAQQEVIEATFDSVSKMIEDIEETSAGVTTITENAKACVTAKDDIADIISSLSGISEQNAASTEETGASTQELSATVDTLSQSAGSLKEVSAALLDEMSFFKRN